MNLKMKFCLIFKTLAFMTICSGCDGEGVTPFMKAAYSGNDEELSEFISKGADLNEKSSYGWTALMFASQRGNTECVKRLLAAGADPNIVSGPVPSSLFETRGGYPPTTALSEATRNSHFDIAYILMDSGAKIDGNAISLAAEKGYIKLITHMVKLGGDVNDKSNSASFASPLCAASSSGKLEMVQWLITHGANPNLESLEQTPLEEAAYADRVEIVKYLLENGADPNLVYSSLQTTVLIEAVIKYTDYEKYDENLSIIKLLLSKGANENYRGYGNETALGKLKNQRANYIKADRDMADPKIRRQYEDALRHMDAIISLLEK